MSYKIQMTRKVNLLVPIQKLCPLFIFSLCVMLCASPARADIRMRQAKIDAAKKLPGSDISFHNEASGKLFKATWSSPQGKGTEISTTHLQTLLFRVTPLAPGSQSDFSKLEFTATMPQHRHGLGAEPQVQSLKTKGEFAVKDIHFIMPGWWKINLTLKQGAEGKIIDEITFHIMVKP